MPRSATPTSPSRWLCTTRKCTAPSAAASSGLSIAADSLAAIKYAKVYPIYNKDAKTTPGHENEYVEGADDDLIVGYRTEGDFPLYGNDDDRADDIAKWVVSTVMGQGQASAGVPRRRPDPVHPDHHLQRRIRQGHRFLPVRPPEGHPVRSGRQPGERHGLPRHARRPCSPSARSTTTTLLTASR